MVFEYIIRSSPRRRASHSVAEGFSPTASPAYRMNFSKTILPAETRCGRDARAPRRVGYPECEHLRFREGLALPATLLPPPRGRVREGQALPAARGRGKPVPPG